MSGTLAPVLGEASVQELRDALRGELLQPGDEGYAEAKLLWNGAHDGSEPAVIARCTGPADVIAALGFARAHDLTVAVRGGGHSIPGYSTNDGGMVIDLGPLRNVRVDQAARRAYVGGGAVWGDVDHETQQFGLATTGGLVTTTGVAGFTLGGGIGWLMRQYGLACDNLVGADVVTADGRFLHASAEENADLFWGLRGGGGNFGIVTSFELALHPVGPEVYAGPLFLPAEADVDLLRFYRDWAPSQPDCDHDGDQPRDRAAAAGNPGGVARQEGGDRDRRLRRAGRRRRGARPRAAHDRGAGRRPDPPDALQLHPGPARPALAEGDQRLLQGGEPRRSLGRDDRLARGAAPRHAGAAVRDPRPPDGRRGRARRAGRHGLPRALDAVRAQRRHGDAGRPELLGAHTEWARAVIASAEADETGRAYVNFLGDSGEAESAYGEETYRRLVALKDEYDPTNVFRLNQNIEPSA